MINKKQAKVGAGKRVSHIMPSTCSGCTASSGSPFVRHTSALTHATREFIATVSVSFFYYPASFSPAPISLHAMDLKDMEAMT